MPSGYLQQNPWLTIATKQMEIMHRYMTEIGLTPAARSRVTTGAGSGLWGGRGGSKFAGLFGPRPWE